MPKARLRGDKMAMPCSVDTDKGLQKGVLVPNKWVELPEELWQMLRYKFGRGNPTTPALDPDANEKNPHGLNEVGETREESVFDHEVIIEFKR